MQEEIRVAPPFIKLEQFLKFAGVAETGGHAKMMIVNRDVLVNDEICIMRGKKLYDGDVVQLVEDDVSYKCIISDL